jgi:hypothetical protein
MQGNLSHPAGIDFEAVGAYMACLMRKWLGAGVAESALVTIGVSGDERLRELVRVTSEKSGLEERVIVKKLAEDLGSEVGQRVAIWYEGWSSATSKGVEAMKGSLPGDGYLVYEGRSGDAAASIFIDQMLEGKPGLVLTRRARPAILGFNVEDVKIVMVRKQLAALFWHSAPVREMTDRRERAFEVATEMPLLRVVRSQMESRPGTVVLMDCAEFLKVINGFQKLYTLVADIMDIAADGGGVLIVSANPKSFSDGEMSTLETLLEVLVEREAAQQPAHRSPIFMPNGSVSPS